MLFWLLASCIQLTSLVQDSPIEAPLFQVVDLDLNEETLVRLSNVNTAKLKLVSVVERRDSIRDAVRSAKVVVEINGEVATR